MSRHAEQARANRQSLVVAILCVAGTVVALQQTLVVPLIPDWPRLLNTSEANAGWLVTATLLSGAVATPLLARLADMVGKKKIMLIALGCVVAGSVLGALGSGFATIVTARALQGVGACLIPIGISILRDELPRERVGGAVATMSATLGIGSAIGLPLAGLIVEHFTWHAVFWVSGLTGALMLIGVIFIVPESKVKASGRFDVIGGILLSGILLALLIPITKGGSWGWESEDILFLFGVCLALLAIWVPWELRHRSPLVDLRTSARRPVLLTNIASLLVGFAMYANMMTTTQQLQLPTSTGFGFGLSLLASGVTMLPGGIAMVLLSPVSAVITKRYGARITLMAGSITLATAYALRVYLTHAVWQVIIGATLSSAGTAMAYAAMPNLIMRSVPLTETASANGLNTLLRSIGTSTSSAAVAAILTNMTFMHHGIEMPTLSAFRTVWVIASIAALASAVVASLVPAPTAVTSIHTPIDQSVRGGDSNEVVATGVLTDLDGKPLRRGVVTALGVDGTHLDWGRVDEQGSYRIALPGQGRYVLVASAEGWATRSQFIQVTGPSLPQMTLSRPLQLTGRVIGNTGPVPITLIKHSGEYHAGTTCDADGAFALPLPAPGRYVVTALNSEREESAAASITVSTEPIDVVLELAASHRVPSASSSLPQSHHLG